jgi:hypothetical protein
VNKASCTLAAVVGLVALANPGFPSAARRPPPPQAVTASALRAVVAGLRVSPQALELEARPALTERLRETPHAYFRFVSRQFTRAVCVEFRSVRTGFPDVNLHGDPHLEQYAVTSLGRGLTDFDESARGPSFIDLVRFGVSLELAARERHWPGEGRRAFGAFLGGYRQALQDPSIDSAAPPAVARARTTFARNHHVALRRAERMMEADPVPSSEIEAISRDYVARMLENSADMNAGFFSVKQAGRPALGIGSAFDEKYLFRIEGRSTAAGDDQILEAKLVRPLSDVGCVRTDQGPERVPLGMALIAHAPFPFSGLLTHRNRTFWVRGWTDDYTELSIDSWLTSPEDLRQVAYDVGIQLGRAHPKAVAGKDSRVGFRKILLAVTDKNEGRIRSAVNHLTAATVAAWKAFRASAAS